MRKVAQAQAKASSIDYYGTQMSEPKENPRFPTGEPRKVLIRGKDFGYSTYCTPGRPCIHTLRALSVAFGSVRQRDIVRRSMGLLPCKPLPRLPDQDCRVTVPIVMCGLE